MKTENVLVNVREYSPSDFPQLVKVYKSAFAEPPWDEFMKCVSCGVNYGIEEVKQKMDDCKKCNSSLELVEFWSPKDIQLDLDFAFSQDFPVVLVAESQERLVGSIWGYGLPFAKFPFLRDKVNERANYMDDVMVRADFRGRGIGKKLCKSYFSIVYGSRVNSPETVLRTDVRNAASMSLFRATGFESLGIRDPEFQFREYLRRKR